MGCSGSSPKKDDQIEIIEQVDAEGVDESGRTHLMRAAGHGQTKKGIIMICYCYVVIAAVVIIFLSHWCCFVFVLSHWFCFCHYSCRCSSSTYYIFIYPFVYF